MLHKLDFDRYVSIPRELRSFEDSFTRRQLHGVLKEVGVALDLGGAAVLPLR
jgi:hypothetical protein